MDSGFTEREARFLNGDMRRQAEGIVAVILNELVKRKGFDYWWHDIDDNVKEEMVKTLQEKVLKLL